MQEGYPDYLKNKKRKDIVSLHLQLYGCNSDKHGQNKLNFTFSITLFCVNIPVVLELSLSVF